MKGQARGSLFPSQQRWNDKMQHCSAQQSRAVQGCLHMWQGKAKQPSKSQKASSHVWPSSRGRCTDLMTAGLLCWYSLAAEVTCSSPSPSQGIRLTMEPVCHKEGAFLIIGPGLRAICMHNEGPLEAISLVAGGVIMPQIASRLLVHLDIRFSLFFVS